MNNYYKLKFKAVVVIGIALAFIIPGASVLADSDYEIIIVSDTALPGEIDNIIEVNGSWIDTITGYSVDIQWQDTTAGVLQNIEITLTGCIDESPSYFSHQIIGDGESGGRIQVTVLTHAPIAPGSGKLFNIVHDVDAAVPPQIVDIIAYPGTNGYFAGLFQIAEVIPGQLEIINNPPLIPGVPGGPQQILIGRTGVFNASTTDPEGDDISYKFSWGDGSESAWTTYHPSGELIQVNKAFLSTGSFDVKVKARDIYEEESDWSDPLTVEVYNNPPDDPQIDGPSEGLVDVQYDFDIVSNDMDGHTIKYTVDWDDGSTPYQTSLMHGGQSIHVNHTWAASGDYVIEVTVTDQYGAESFGTHEITIEAAELEIGDIKGGLFQISSSITNIGGADATNVDWSINVDGLVFIGKEITGSESTLAASDSIDTIDKPFIGFGPVTITITANADGLEEITKTADGFALFVFVIIQ